MTTCTALTAELSTIEKKITAMRKASEKKVQKEEHKVALLNERRAAVIEDHRQEVAGLVEEVTRQIEGMQEKARKQVEEARSQAEEFLRREADALEATEHANRKAKDLEKQIKHMHKILDTARAEYETRWSNLIHRADEDVRQKVADANLRVRECSDHAGFIQDSTLDAMDEMRTAMRKKLEDADQTAGSRSRYQDLYNLTLNRSAQELESEDFMNSKVEVLREWHDAWHEVTGGLQAVPANVLNRHRHHVDLAASLPKPVIGKDGLQPSKFVQRCRERAVEDKRRTSGSSGSGQGGALRLPPAAGATAAYAAW